MKNKPEGMTIIIGIIVFLAAGSIAWLTITNLIVALAKGLTSGLGDILLSFSTSPISFTIVLCVAGFLVVLTLKNVIAALANGISGAAKSLNDSISDYSKDE